MSGPAGDEHHVEVPAGRSAPRGLGSGLPAERFRSLYEATISRLYAYAGRSLVIPLDQVDDVISDVYLTIWRRIDDLPDPPEDVLWLFGVARHVISRHQRGLARRGRLVERLRRERIVPPADDPSDRIIDVLKTLRPRDRELIHLTIWEGLSYREAGLVLGCSENAVKIRLHRARRRLAERLGAPGGTRANRPTPQIGELEMPT